MISTKRQSVPGCRACSRPVPALWPPARPRLPFFCCLRQRNSCCCCWRCCLGHACLDSCKDNTLLDLCVCVFDKWWRLRRSALAPPSLPFASVFCCFFCLGALLFLLLLFLLLCFGCSHTHCRCCRRFASLLILIRIVLARILALPPPPPRLFLSRPAMAPFLYSATNQALDTCSFYLLPARAGADLASCQHRFGSILTLILIWCSAPTDIHTYIRT